MTKYLLTGLALAVAALGTAGTYLYWRLETVKEQRNEYRAALTQSKTNEKVVTRYVNRIVEVPGPAVIRERLVGRVCHEVNVPGPAESPEAAAPDAVAGRGDGGGEAGRAAESLRNARLNHEQCAALIEVIAPQAK